MSYLIALLVSAAGMAVLDRRWRLVLWRATRSAALVVLLGTVFFLVWDLVAIGLGIFRHGDSAHMTGVLLAPELPLEEPVFLAFLCYTALVLFAGAERILEWVQERRRKRVSS
ncbi:lycopene cyclase domain-containing protein [Arthrobacter woluwensis]|uniref:lycopene cyclase domain-containing protein n=1 Tax=Arthrobacter woluwensis TaxID=156980 RepID=UPI00278452D4|nr:lycopene cyclase domain-containing protein [Arthrobacter woluwensis]MDQ0708800.1 lycopene cyclase domain-containing protein [Arthrobacter woluwensis]